MYSVQTLDRQVRGGFRILLEAWDHALALLRTGRWPRVAILDHKGAIVMVLQTPRKDAP